MITNEKIDSVCKKTKIQLFLTAFFAVVFLGVIYFLWTSEFEIPFLVVLLLIIVDCVVAYVISNFLRMKPIVILNHFFDVQSSRKMDFEINGRKHFGKNKNLAEQNERIRTFYEGNFEKCIEINIELLNHKVLKSDCLKFIAMSYFFLNDEENFNMFFSNFVNSLSSKNTSDILLNKNILMTMHFILQNNEKAVCASKELVVAMEKSQPVHFYIAKYLYAVSLFNSGKKENAKPVFEDIAKTAEKVMIGRYAKAYLSRLN